MNFFKQVKWFKSKLMTVEAILGGIKVVINTSLTSSLVTVEAIVKHIMALLLWC